ncbi:MAG: TfoX/Sxy family DNA transformation protein [Bdellovibrio sp.]|nr:TfoX/Sxy family DNA transformation protein [Bdellovibrio sp.]
MAKELENLYWIEDLLPKVHVRKKMFGGFAYYVDEKLVLLMFESFGHKTYRSETFNFEIWNGCMFPVEKENQVAVLEKHPHLVVHPILAKWLYLPTESEDFESHIENLLPEFRRKNPLFGTYPKRKSFSAGSKKATRVKKLKAEDLSKVDTRKPRMFSDEPAENVLLKARRITDLKNLGPETEKAFLKAGIKTPQQFIKLGWKKSMTALCKVNPKNNYAKKVPLKR